MKTNPVPGNPAGLVGFAQAMAAVLSERSNELGISRDVEALLRASIGRCNVRDGHVCRGHCRRKEIAGGHGIIWRRPGDGVIEHQATETTRDAVHGAASPHEEQRCR